MQRYIPQHSIPHMKHKQDLINKGNKQENENRREHTYNKGDKVLLLNAWKTKFNHDAYLGP